MKDIARQLGISRTTVSLALKGEGQKYRITPATVAKVKELASTLNFSPDAIATALTTRKTKTIGAILPNAFETFMSKMIKGIEEYLYPAGYSMMLCTSRFDTTIEKRNIEMLTQRNVDGIILVFSAPFSGEPYDYSHIQRLVDTRIPLVFADRFLPTITGKTNVVAADDFAGAFDAVSALIARGCRSIGYISLDLAISSLDMRYQGYSAACTAHKIVRANEHEIRITSHSMHSNDLTKALVSLRDAHIMPDGFLITTNGLAHTASRILGEIADSVHQISIAAFGTEGFDLSGTTICIDQPHEKIGFESAQLLIDIIEGRKPLDGNKIIVPQTVFAQSHTPLSNLESTPEYAL